MHSFNGFLKKPFIVFFHHHCLLESNHMFSFYCDFLLLLHDGVSVVPPAKVNLIIGISGRSWTVFFNMKLLLLRADVTLYWGRMMGWGFLPSAKGVQPCKSKQALNLWHSDPQIMWVMNSSNTTRLMCFFYLPGNIKIKQGSVVVKYTTLKQFRAYVGVSSSIKEFYSQFPSWAFSLDTSVTHTLFFIWWLFQLFPNLTRRNSEPIVLVVPFIHFFHFSSAVWPQLESSAVIERCRVHPGQDGNLPQD